MAKITFTDELAALITGVTKHYDAERAKMQKHLEMGYLLDSFRVKALHDAEVKASLVLRHFELPILDEDRAKESFKTLITSLEQDIRSAIRGAASSGDMNSTCSMTRALAASALEAKADLLERLTRLTRFA